MLSARVRASLTIESALERASESNCSDLVLASASMPSDSVLASAVSRSAISWARPSTFAAWTLGSPFSPPSRPAAVACVCSVDDGGGTGASRREGASSRCGAACWAAGAEAPAFADSSSPRVDSSSASSCSTCWRSSLLSSINRASSVSTRSRNASTSSSL
ncbi:hypothetical protein ACZ91_15220 [Streptomyces regensis]|nr:hypothetical protein ACZ91_15220 [Streptomyces regensis]